MGLRETLDGCYCLHMTTKKNYRRGSVNWLKQQYRDENQYPTAEALEATAVALDAKADTVTGVAAHDLRFSAQLARTEAMRRRGEF